MRKSNLVHTDTGEKYRMEHEWDVAGDAEVEDIVGNIQDLIGIPLLMVEEVSFDNETPKWVKHQGIEDNSYTWTSINLQKSKVVLQCKNNISKEKENVPRPIAETEGYRTKNIMKRICSILLFILLTSCTPVQNAPPTKQTGVLSLDTLPACRELIDGLCVVSEPGEWLGEGKTTIINERPEAAFLDETTALQIKIGGWTLVFSPGLNTPFSVGMTFPDATLYPAGGYSVSMTVENNGKKCDSVEGIFTDDILQTAEKNGQQINPISSFDIRFAMRCNRQSQVILGRVKLSQ